MSYHLGTNGGFLRKTGEAGQHCLPSKVATLRVVWQYLKWHEARALKGCKPLKLPPGWSRRNEAWIKAWLRFALWDRELLLASTKLKTITYLAVCACLFLAAVFMTLSILLAFGETYALMFFLIFVSASTRFGICSNGLLPNTET